MWSPAAAYELLEQMPMQDGERKFNDPLKRWKQIAHQFPELATLAREYLWDIPATSAPLERISSRAARVITAKRSCIDPIVTCRIDASCLLKKIQASSAKIGMNSCQMSLWMSFYSLLLLRTRMRVGIQLMLARTMSTKLSKESIVDSYLLVLPLLIIANLLHWKSRDIPGSRLDGPCLGSNLGTVPRPRRDQPLSCLPQQTYFLPFRSSFLLLPSFFIMNHDKKWQRHTPAEGSCDVAFSCCSSYWVFQWTLVCRGRWRVHRHWVVRGRQYL